ncbi:hypothetical protein C5167_003954, partial [Papaver somniferum]
MNQINSLLLVLAILSSPIFFISASSSESSSNGEAEDILIRQRHFKNFLKKFGKKYADEDEHSYRFSVFKSNLERAKRHQSLDPPAVHGVTQFSDLTPTEFRKSVLGLRSLKLPTDAQQAPILPTNDLPTDFDWRDHGMLLMLRISTTGALEGANFLAKGKLVSLSEQQLVDCDHE